MTRRSRVARAASALVACLLAIPTTAAAQPTDAPVGDPSARLVVSALDPILGGGTLSAEAVADPEIDPPTDLTLRVLVENDGEIPLRGLRVAWEVFTAARSRADLRDALDRDDPGPRMFGDDERVRGGETLEPGDVAALEITITGDQGRWVRSGSGVYPLRLTVGTAFDALDSVTTAVTYLDDRPGATDGDGAPTEDTGPPPLAATMVWPLDDMPWRSVGGVYPAEVDGAIRDGQRLDRILTALERHQDAPVLFAPAPHLLEDLADRVDGFLVTGADGEPRAAPADAAAALRAAAFLDRVRATSDALPLDPIAGPYADAVVTALTGQPEPLPTLAADAVGQGRSRLQLFLTRETTSAAYLATTPLDDRVLDLLPGDVVVLPWEYVRGAALADDPDLPNPVRSLRSPADRRLTATVADPYVTQLLSSPSLDHGPLVAANRVLAETAQVYLEQEAGVAALVMMPTVGWDPDLRFADALLGWMTGATWVRLGSPATQVTAVTAPPDDVTLTLGAVGPLPPEDRDELIEAATSLASLREALPEETTRVDGRTYDELADQLLRVSSGWFRGSASGRASAMIVDVQKSVDEGFGTVEVPTSARITLTSERGTIPVTVRRTSGGPIKVRVEVSSSGRLDWPEGEVWEGTLTSDGTQTVSFDTIALTGGTFGVRVDVTAGSRMLASKTLSVRSTAIGGFALWVTGGIVLALLLFGAVRRRGPDRPQLEVVG